MAWLGVEQASLFTALNPIHQETYAYIVPAIENKLTAVPLIFMIVPVKNEDGNIENCVTLCLNSTYPKKVIIVNDGSTYKTGDTLMQLAYKNLSLKVIHLQKSVGKKVGYRSRCKYCKWRYLPVHGLRLRYRSEGFSDS
jgi:cellulose synthase/poly-beta-1,6-N-acetylglucosamine synthase-like glycosyltransferase